MLGVRQKPSSRTLNTIPALARLCLFFGDGKSYLRNPSVFKGMVFEHHIENRTFEKSRG
jgi:hypothetical protein